MSNNISLIETTLIDEKIQKVLRQTDYTNELAFEKLKENDFDEVLTIKKYLGITEKKAIPVKSVNQEIFKQIRYRLDSNIKNYQERLDKNELKNNI